MIQGNARLHKGFTLIELMLSMTFVSVLLLAIAMTVIQIGNIYSKGMALKDINQSSRTFSDDVRRTVAAAGAVTINSDTFIQTSVAGKVVSGRLCLGNYSYIWNTADALPAQNEAFRMTADSTKLIGVVKVPDSASMYCARTSGGALSITRTLRTQDVARATELLTKGDHTLSLTNFTVETANGVHNAATGQRLLTINYGIGTGAPTAMNAGRTACLAPGQTNADPTYCNVQHFTMIVRSGGGN